MILLKIFMLQLVAVAVILFVLWKMLRRELVEAALQALEAAAPRSDVAEVSAVSAAALSSVDEARLMALLKQKFPSAAIGLAVNAQIRSGLVIKAGELLLDYSFLTRMKSLFGQQDT